MGPMEQAWTILKQLQLNPSERNFVYGASPEVPLEFGNGATMLQSNLGLFDPDLAVQDDDHDDPIRIGQGQRRAPPPQIESEFITQDGDGNYELRGVPASGGPSRLMSELSAETKRSGMGLDSTHYLTNLAGKTDKDFRRRGNYEKLMRGLLSAGLSIHSNNRNRMSNPFHNKFAQKFGHLYGPHVGTNRMRESRFPLETYQNIHYDVPAIRGTNPILGTPEPTITQRPLGAKAKFGSGASGNPLGGFGSLARYDFGAVPFRRPRGFNRGDEQVTVDEYLRNLPGQTEQTLLTEALRHNMHRNQGKSVLLHANPRTEVNDPMTMEQLMSNRRVATPFNASRQYRRAIMADEMPDAYRGGFQGDIIYPKGARDYGVGLHTGHQMAIDQNTGQPALLFHPDSTVGRRLNREEGLRNPQGQVQQPMTMEEMYA